MRINLKIRPVGDWAKDMLDKESPMFDKDSINDFKQIPPVYFKENFYLLTENGKKKCWHEIKTDEGFIAIETDVESFEYGLNEDNYLKTPKKLIEALKKVDEMDKNILTDKQKDLIWRYEWMMQEIYSLRQTRISWQKWFKEDEKEFPNG